jgi:hypothetical protein
MLGFDPIEIMADYISKRYNELTWLKIAIGGKNDEYSY